jgi:UDP-glucose 4-epimerase
VHLKIKRVMVTGSEGFVGTHLISRLRRERVEVIALDLLDGLDITDWTQIKELPKVDLLYHLAGMLYVPDSRKFPRDFYEANVLGTLNLLEYCRLHNSRMIFTSSYLYGNPQYLPIDEKHPLNPTNPYARTKAMAEALCLAYSSDFNLRCIVLRPFNIYGVGQKQDFLIPLIFRQIKKNHKITLEHSEPKRDMLYIDDFIDAYIKAGEYDQVQYEVFNIGYGKSYKVRDIVEKIVQHYRHRITVQYLDEQRPQEIMNTVADIRKAKDILGWEPKIDIDEGLRRVVDAFKKA